MSNKTVKIDASENNKQNSVVKNQHDENPTINIRNNDPSIHSIGNKYDNLVSEAVDNNPTENNDAQNDLDDKSYKDDEKETHKKDYSERKITVIGAYLRSEFSGLNARDDEVKHDKTAKLSKYKEINIRCHGRKYVGNKKPDIYSKDIVIVQFMGSEKMPESRVLMTYEPETRNYTVKGMYVMLMFLHFFSLGFIATLFISPARDGMIPWGHVGCIPCFVIYFIIVIFVACFHICRNACCTSIATFFACFFLSGFYGALGGYLGKRIFIFNTFAAFVADIFLIFLACGTFNFTSKGAYIIGITAHIVGLLIGMPSMEFYATHNIYYWADDKFPQENWLSYLLTVAFTCITATVQIAQLQLLLNGEWVELGENDYSFGAYLMFVSLVDYPIRFMRKRGWLASCDTGGGEDDDDEE